jgi:RNA polymerase sigma-70 factor (ECF subfamily)
LAVPNDPNVAPMARNGQDLVSKAAAGDYEALQVALSEHGPGVRARLRVSPRWQSDLTIDDVMQEAYLRALRSMPHFPRSGDAFAGWLFLLARNSLVDAIRGRRSERRGGEHRRVAAPVGEEAWVELFGVVTETPSREAARGEAKRIVQAALTHLSESERSVIELCYIQCMSIKEVADVLECTKGAVHMRRARALRLLHQLLGATSKYF